MPDMVAGKEAGCMPPCRHPPAPGRCRPRPPYPFGVRSPSSLSCALAADSAVGAAQKLIAARLDDKRASSLIADSIKGLGEKLN